MNAHSNRINSGFLVRHRLRLEPMDTSTAGRIENEIHALKGIQEVQIEPARGVINLAYDGSQHHIDELLGIMQTDGAVIRTGWRNRMKLGFDRQVDNNVRDNAGNHPSCCSRPPIPSHMEK